MKNDKYILDNYLHDKVAEAKFDMQESHWQKALEALEGEENAPKRIFPWLRTLLLASLLLISGAIYYITNSNQKPKIVQQQNNATNVDTNSSNTSNTSKPTIDNNPILPSQNTTTDKVIKTSTTKTQYKNSNTALNASGQSKNVKESIATNKAEPTEKILNGTPVNTNENTPKNKVKTIKQNIAKLFAKAQPTPEELVAKKQKANLQLQQKAELQATNKAIAVAKHLADETAKEKIRLAKLAIANEKLATQKIETENAIAKKELAIANMLQQKEAKKVAMQLAILEKEKKEIVTLEANAVAKKAKASIKAMQVLQKQNARLATIETNKKTSDAKKIAIIKQASDTKKEAMQTTAVEKNNDVATTTAPKVIVPLTKSNPRYIDAKDLQYKPKKKQDDDDNTDWTSVKSVRTIVAPKKKIVDTIVKATATAAQMKPKFNAVKTKASATINAQISMANSVKSATNTNTWQPTPYIGFGYWCAVTNRWDVHMQLGATYINNLAYNYTATNYNYGFGVDSTLFTIQQKTLYQLCIPVSLSYKLSLRQSILGGVGANIGLDVLSNVKQFNSNTSANTWGYDNGYNTFAPFATLGYQYQFTTHLFLQAMYQQGLRDITNNTTFGNTSIDNNSKATIGITYKLK